MRERHNSARAQDVSDDDRKHLRWCLGKLNHFVVFRHKSNNTEEVAALDFITAILVRDYGLEEKP